MKTKSSEDITKIAHDISYHHTKHLDLFRDLDPKLRPEVILTLSKHVRHDIVSKLTTEEVVSLVEQLDSDDATDVLQLLPVPARQPVLEQISRQRKDDISMLLHFDPETAAGLMDVNYIRVSPDATIAQVANRVKLHEKRTGKSPVILVVKAGKLAGYLPNHELGYSRTREKITKKVKKIFAISQNANTDEVVDAFRRHPHNKIVVLTKTGSPLGIIYSDDVLHLLQDKESESLLEFAGVHKEESVYDSTGRKVKYRYKWLMINLGTAFLAAFTVGLFDETISKYVLLAVYMPIVAGMGGNAATQTLAVLVRGISQNQIDLSNMWQTLKSELGAGVINGVINGFIIALIVYLKDGDYRIGLILSAAMIINLIVASFFGTVVPLIMKRLRKDPASSATIFITTATDIFGFLVFLGLATLILG